MHKIHDQTLDLSIFYQMDMNLYPLFIAIYEQKSISKAAHLLCLSQSAASHALQRLRQFLQDELFVRTGNKMLATPFAEQIYTKIKSALFVMQNISTQKQQFDVSMLQSIKIAVHDEIEPLIFPKLVAHFSQLHADIQFSSIKLDRKTIVADLATQQIDFVFDIEQNFGEKLQFQSLIQDHFVVCTQQPKMNSELYFSAAHIGVSARRTGLLLEDIYLQSKQHTRQIFLRCQHYSTALQILLDHPQAMLTVAKGMLNDVNLQSNLNVFELPFDFPEISLGFYWHKDLVDNLRYVYLRNEILKIFS